MTSDYNGWGVDLGGGRLAGRYFFRGPHSVHMEGHRLAVFPTRDDARKAVKHLKETWPITYPNARVLKVHVTVEYDR